VFRLDPTTRQAIEHTKHCLVGCGTGEVLGSATGAALHWSNFIQTVLAILLAFLFGYTLTFRGARRMGLSTSDARRTALQTDTLSITSMEIIDTTLEWVIPGALNAVVISWLFWWSMALSLIIAFAVTVPVNRFLMIRFGIGHNHHDTHH